MVNENLKHIDELPKADTLVLVVDDSSTEVKLIRNYFRSVGFDVEIASSGFEGLGLLDKGKNYDLIVLDVMMPGINGLDVCRKIRENYSLFELPILFLTGLRDIKDIIEGFNAGANDFLSKPYNAKEFLARAKTLVKLKKLTEANVTMQEMIKMKNKILSELENEIKERTRIENELIMAKEYADSANKFKSEFIANMSHEIRTPLNSILGFSDLLKDRLLDIKGRDYVEAIITGGKNLLTLINDILDISKIEAGKIELDYEPFNIEVILNEIRQIFDLKLKTKGLDLIIEIKDTLPKNLILDESRLRQILLNIVGNAVKFTEKGIIKIEAYNEHCDRDIKYTDLTLNVYDSGIGIPTDHHQRIFEAFNQVTGSNGKHKEGTGLGLTITKRLVEMMGGTISVKSTSGEGSVFKIYIPQIEYYDSDTLVKSPDIETNYKNVKFEKSTLLLVDDNQHNRSLICEFLAGTNIDIIEGENGEEAINQAKTSSPDIIFMDLKMPVMDGYAANRVIKSLPETSSIPVIAITASVMKSDIEKIEKEGFNGFISKPIIKNSMLKELSKFIKIQTGSVDFEFPQNAEGAIQKKSSFDEIVDITGLIAKLENEFFTKNKNMVDSFRLGVIKDFATELIELGRNHNARKVIEYGEGLIKECGTFDFKRIKVTLKDYPALIEKFKINF